MKRFGMFAPCLVIAFAIAALACASASATEPEFLECAKLTTATGAYSNGWCTNADPKHKGKYELQTVTHPTSCRKVEKVGKHYTGKYDNKTCTEEDPAHEGKYELTAPKEGVGKKGKAFSGRGGRMTIWEWEPREELQITCRSDEDEGLVTGPTTISNFRLEFSDCEGPLNKFCQSSGAKSGVIETEPLVVKLGYINAETHDVGIDVAPASGETFAAINCEGLSYRLLGSIVLGVRGDVNALSQTFFLENFAEYGGYYDGGIESLEGQPRDIIETEYTYDNGIVFPKSTMEFGPIKNKSERLELKA